jgi:hypothetical protein
MNQALYEKLKEVARARSVITYSDIAPLVGVDIRTSPGRREIGRLIAEVCAHEVEHGRPMLGSVVVRKDTGMPGDGYFKAAWASSMPMASRTSDRSGLKSWRECTATGRRDRSRLIVVLDLFPDSTVRFAPLREGKSKRYDVPWNINPLL